MKAIKTILHPTDFSQAAMAAFEVACTLASALGARLLLLHVRPMPIKVLPREGIPVPEVADKSEAALRARLDGLAPADSTIAVERYLLVGDEAVEIIDTATETGCDLIVMGTHGRSGMTRLLMGSVAEEVSRKAPCAVVTVKAKPAG
jgi:nucleotide-binding universal stress UspA family protein